jgi:hypothetical protein
MTFKKSDGPKVTVRAGSVLSRDLDMGVAAHVIKATAGVLRGVILCNMAAAIRYVKIYDKATAATEADTPVMTIGLQANQTLPIIWPQGSEPIFENGICARGTTALADNSVAAPTAGDVVADFFYS